MQYNPWSLPALTFHNILFSFTRWHSLLIILNPLLLPLTFFVCFNKARACQIVTVIHKTSLPFLFPHPLVTHCIARLSDKGNCSSKKTYWITEFGRWCEMMENYNIFQMNRYLKEDRVGLYVIHTLYTWMCILRSS